MIWQADGSDSSLNFYDRGSFYYGDAGSIALPGSVWGGCEKVDGGNDAYARYAAAYNQIVETESGIDISVQLELTEEDFLQITTQITLEEALESDNNKLIFIITENLSETYFSSVRCYQELDFDLSESGDTGIYSFSFPYCEEWCLSGLNGMVLVQTFNDYPAENEHLILQAGKTILSGVWPDFTADIVNGPPALQVAFTDLSYAFNGISSWSWDFGDGSTSSEISPSHLYEECGVYDVNLTISNGITSETLICPGLINVASNEFSGGPVAGVWSSIHGTYTISGDTFVETGKQLLIESGVEIICNNANLRINGILNASGTIEERIVFSSEDDWYGILFDNSDGSKLEYCDITGSTAGAVKIESSEVEILNCNIYANTSTNKASGIDVLNSDNVIVRNCIIAGNYSTEQCGGILCSYSNIEIINNLIVNNNGSNSSALNIKFTEECNIINNTIAGNLSENCCIFIFNASPLFCNNIIQDESVTILAMLSDPSVNHCCISGNYAGENNIDEDPIFVLPSSGSGYEQFNWQNDWHLAEGSPCLDNGFNEVVDWQEDLNGNVRIINNTVDMGAYEFQGVIGNDDDFITENISIRLENHPNPFNPETVISFNIPDKYDLTSAKLEIFNTKGQKVKTFKSTNLEPGNNAILWDGKDNYQNAVASGVFYFCLQISDRTFSRKMLLIK